MKKIPIISLFVLVFGIVTAWAQCEERGSIKFPRGQSSAVVTGRIGRARSVCYKVRAREGQELSLSLVPPLGGATFTVGSETYDAEPLVEDVTTWRGDLSDGRDYFISVSAPRSGTTFVLKVTIR